MDLSCPWTVKNEILQKCREAIPLVQVCFRFELSFPVSKLLSKIWVNPWNFDQIFVVSAFFSAKWRQTNYKTRLFKLPTPEYTIPKNFVRIGRVVTENERWIQKINQNSNKKLDHIPLMRYCIASIRDNQRTRSCLIWIDCVWKKSVDNEALVAWPSRDFRRDMT